MTRTRSTCGPSPARNQEGRWGRAASTSPAAALLRFVGISALAGVLCLGVWARTATADAVSQALAAARKDLQQGRVEEAKKRLESLVRAHPGDARPVPLLAYILMEKEGRVRRPATMLIDCLKHNPKDQDARRQLENAGYMARNRGHFELAVKVWRTLADLEPEDDAYRYQFALTAYRAGRLDLVKKVCGRLIDEDPSYARAYELLASAELDAGNPEGAVDVYRRLLQESPGNTHVRLELGSALLWYLRRYDDAIEQFRSAEATAGSNKDLVEQAINGRRSADSEKQLSKHLRHQYTKLGYLLAVLFVAFVAFFCASLYVTRRPPAGRSV